MERDIKNSVQQLLDAIEARDGVRVAGAMERVEDLLARGRGSLHPQLVHFLQNRSYAKALMFLGGKSDIPVGVCGGRAGRS